MKKLLLLLLLPAFAHAQQYTRNEIRYAADSVMKSFVKEGMFAHSKNELNTDAYVYYSYTDKKGKVKHAEVPRGDRYTRGNFRSVEIWYRVAYPYPKCILSNMVHGEACVTLDRYLDMKKSPDISFIPDYVWEGDSCRHTARNKY